MWTFDATSAADTLAFSVLLFVPVLVLILLCNLTRVDVRILKVQITLELS